MAAQQPDVSLFSEEIRQQVLAAANDAGGTFLEEEYALIVSEYLTEAGEIDDINVCSYRGRGMQLSAYAVSDDEETLDLFLVRYGGDLPPANIPSSQIRQGFTKLLAFRNAANNRLHDSLAPSSPAYDVAFRLWDIKDRVTTIRLFYITDGIVRPTTFDEQPEDGVSVSYHVWDLLRLFRLESSGKKRETIEISLSEDSGQNLPVLGMPVDNDYYSSWLTIIPAEVLAKIYEKYGPRLLERNVRSFLQARGAVNAGMRKTILNEPDMFLAYNNGLTATAESVEIVNVKGTPTISVLRDLQIVNGAQTTASLFQAWKKDGADLSRIQVQMKLTEIKDSSRMDEFVSRISQYANSQNKIQAADFDANDPYHRSLEELSRTIWAPSISGTMRQTHWFYERARGQYADGKSRAGTRAQVKAFEEINPRQQKFTKTDVAKYENTWGQYPHYVSRGAQKNFREFTIRLKERGKFVPDQIYFEQLIGEAILFRTTEKIVQKLALGGYRANVVTYTLALLSHRTAQRIDMQKIWKDQGVPDSLRALIERVAPKVFNQITSDAGASNVTEWCKKPACWDSVKDITVDISDVAGLMTNRSEIPAMGANKGGLEALTDEEKERLAKVVAVHGNVWMMLSAWARETNNLSPWHRTMAYNLGLIISKGRSPSRKQAYYAQQILEEAERLGFDPLHTEVQKQQNTRIKNLDEY